MRILHICQRDDPNTGGSLRVAEALVREQRRAGHDAWLLFLYGPQSDIASGLGPQIVCLGLDSSRQPLRGIAGLCREVWRINPDIIHSHEGIIWPRLAFLLLRKPLVTHSHLPASTEKTFKQGLGWMLTKVTTDHLIGISQHTIKTWVEAGFPSSKITYIPNGVDFDRFSLSSGEELNALRTKLALPIEKKILLWVGRLHKSMKGTDRVERLAHILPDNMMLVVVGQGPAYTGMRERCGELIDVGKLVVAGSVSLPEDYYKAADAYLFTSYYEPFGLVILEAVAAGLPILAFPVTGGGGAVELLREFNAEIIIDDASTDRVYEALDQVLERRKTRETVVVYARQKYSWDKISRQVIKVYERLRTSRKS